ncbi:MAG: hypothetical protein QOF90_2804, partial [Acetobacteraceae bacterium]|nr:hypothetical protein [Acetobacteraceae bacterium]
RSQRSSELSGERGKLANHELQVAKPYGPIASASDASMIPID